VMNHFFTKRDSKGKEISVDKGQKSPPQVVQEI